MPAFYWNPFAPRDEKSAKLPPNVPSLRLAQRASARLPVAPASNQHGNSASPAAPGPHQSVVDFWKFLQWGRGAVGSAPRWHRGGRGFESHRLHQNHIFLYCSAGGLLSWLLHHLFDFPYGSARSTPLTLTPIGATRTTAYLASTKEGRVFHRQLTASSPIRSVCHPHKCLFLNRLVFFSHVTPVTFFRPAETLSSGRHIHR
jgi:hypothetical protein